MVIGNVKRTLSFLRTSHLEIQCNVYGLQKSENPIMTSKCPLSLNVLLIETRIEDLELVKFRGQRQDFDQRWVV